MGDIVGRHPRLALRTAENYASRLRNHILPRWGNTPLGDITPSSVATWANTLHDAGLARETVSSITKLLSMLLADAVDEPLIPANPARRRRRRGRYSPTPPRPERVWATAEEVLRIADRATALGGPSMGVLIITAGWTGARWGELTGLHRANTHPDEGYIVIDPEVGALHEATRTCGSTGPKPPPPRAPSPCRRS
jgi:integrase